MKKSFLLVLATAAVSAACADVDSESLEASEALDAGVEIIDSQSAALGAAGSIGVIPVEDSTGKGICPNGATPVMMKMDDENDDNHTSHTGWVGDIDGSGNTYFHFCRTDGTKFKPVKATADTQNYAVIQLGSSCPAGSASFERYFDTEDAWCDTGWFGLGACGVGAGEFTGDIEPSWYNSGNLHLKFCLFRAKSTGSDTPFPSIGAGYGVFALDNFKFAKLDSSGKKITGLWHSDDEDSDNNDDFSGSTTGLNGIITGPGSATELRTVRIK